MLLLVQLRILSECLPSLTSRFFLNLRSIAFHQPASTFESPDAIRSIYIRPRRTTKQSARLTTELFVENGMEKAIYSSGGYPNEEDTQPGDTFGLEVMVTQTQPVEHDLGSKNYVHWEL